MKKSRKLTAAVLVCLMAVSFCACGKKTSTEEAAAAAKEQFSLGSASGGTYTNEFFDLRLELGSGWTFASQDELISLSNIDAESFDEIGEDALKDMLEEGTLFYDMYAEQTGGASNLNVMIRDAREAFGEDLTVEKVVDLSYNELAQTYSEMGYENAVLEETTVSFRGEEIPCIHIELTVDGTPTYQTQTYLLVDGYLDFITATSYATDDTAEMLGWFDHY